MQPILFLFFRRLRWPLIVLVITYAIAILGMVLIPGIDDQGNPWRMDFFHAFYFVSFMGSTIGFGEIPYPFTDAQRMWTMVIIYATVVAWLYTIGSILGLFQDQGFRHVRQFVRFTKAVQRLQSPFYIICGFTDAGRMLAHELAHRGLICVLIDEDEANIQKVQTDDLLSDNPALNGNAADSETLLAAGLKLPMCRAVIAMTGTDKNNLTIAISSKLLAPKVQVICQSDTKDNAANMASFGTDHIVDPFDIFAKQFAMMFHSPSMYLINQWITTPHGTQLSEFQKPPEGKWVLCGFGRFGKAVSKYLAEEKIETRIIEADVEMTEAPRDTIAARGTEADTLLEANITQAAGIIAGTDDDTNNLSIIITARDLNPSLFTVSRQNRHRNEAIFDAAKIDLIMQTETITAQSILSLIKAPLLNDFFSMAYEENETWANILLSRILGLVEKRAPETWELTISATETPAVFTAFVEGQAPILKHLCTDPRDYQNPLPCIPLLLKQAEQSILLPEMDTPINIGDSLLFCGKYAALRNMQIVINDPQSMFYVRTGKEYAGGLFWQKIFGDQRDQVA
ncbi:MAG: NAD-binding protein [Gammaproteobacteria bacterium]